MMKNIKDIDVENKKVLVRCDFNVPLSEDGAIDNDFKIRASLPTIKYLVKNKAKVVLMSHLDPEHTGFVAPEFTLQHVAQTLSLLLDMPVELASDCVGEEVLQKTDQLQPGQVLLLENLRFHMGEEKNADAFAKNLAKLADIYVNDAFAESHRPYASVVGVPKYLPSYAGLLLEKEVLNLDKILKNPELPLVALIGGVKVGTKAMFIENISHIADVVLIGGLVKKELMEKHANILQNSNIIGPLEKIDAPDIDDTTISIFTENILKAKTIIWNGPLGKFEDESYKKGTLAVAQAIVKSGAFSVVGGGETIEFLDKEGMLSKFNHISTGGGAMLSYLAGENLPGLKALE